MWGGGGRKVTTIWEENGLREERRGNRKQKEEDKISHFLSYTWSTFKDIHIYGISAKSNLARTGG